MKQSEGISLGFFHTFRYFIDQRINQLLMKNNQSYVFVSISMLLHMLLNMEQHIGLSP